MRIGQLLDSIDQNHLFIPAFQREYVWTRKNVKGLFRSLINEYPTGNILTWETSKPPELKGIVKYHENMGSIKLILDGQQRITSLYLIIRDKIPPYYTEKDITNPVRNLYVHIEELDLQYFVKKRMENNPRWINLTSIFKKEIRQRNILKEIELNEELTDKQKDKIDDNFRKIEKILDFDFMEQSIPSTASIREAIDIFYVVNASGINLTKAELALAQMSGYWTEARKIIKKEQRKMKKEGFELGLDFFVYCLLGVMHKVGSSMEKLHIEKNNIQIKEHWNKLTHVIEYTFNLLRSQAFVDSTSEINSIYALIPIVVYTYNKDAQLKEIEIKKLIKWFYYSQLGMRYSSQIQSKLDRDIGIAVSEQYPFEKLLSNLQNEKGLQLTPESFIGVNINHPLFNIMRWYFKSKNAVCLNTGISLRRNIGDKYLLERDHIFPHSVLKENGYNVSGKFNYSLVQEITNRMILTRKANRQKSNSYTIDYLKKIKTDFPNSLGLQCIPGNESLWEIDSFEEFLKFRRKLLSDEINTWLNNITIMETSEADVPIEDLIIDGESDHLEFKSSLRFDYKNMSANKILEFSVLKTIAAFNNSNGGVLIIGVDDDGVPLGLENDYSVIRSGDKDNFELTIYQIILNAFGEVYASGTEIHISFHKFNDKDICKVDIEKGSGPLYLDQIDKGSKHERFFVRIGNQTRFIEKASDVTKYVKKRF